MLLDRALVRAGTLNERITIQVAGNTQGANGEIVLGWTNLFTDGDGQIWASVIDITGREYVAANANQESVQTKITIRYRAGISPTMRVLHRDQIYNIEAVLGQNLRSLLLMCTRTNP